ncbi:hypothetical protein GW17_00018788 [Ensete ventricosum]|nr:hypothetical protein GW17_00018788 [Ensete ventricosum]
MVDRDAITAIDFIERTVLMTPRRRSWRPVGDKGAAAAPHADAPAPKTVAMPTDEALGLADMGAVGVGEA